MEVVVVLKTCVGLLVVAQVVSAVQLYRLLEERAALLVELERLEGSNGKLRDLRREYRACNEELRQLEPHSWEYRKKHFRLMQLKKWIMEEIAKGDE